MKNLNLMVMVAAVAAMFTLTTSAKAQAVGDDGIAASPKLRQFLNERKTVASTPSTSVAVGYSEPGPDGIVASPKLRQQLNERATRVMIAPLK